MPSTRKKRRRTAEFIMKSQSAAAEASPVCILVGIPRTGGASEQLTGSLRKWRLSLSGSARVAKS